MKVLNFFFMIAVAFSLVASKCGGDSSSSEEVSPSADLQNISKDTTTPPNEDPRIDIKEDGSAPISDPSVEKPTGTEGY
ncbi:MAG: hypothetical protein HQK54_10230 [Oligoflexales bacterium]|nr:hypothetical protein [Oligoflexales bacterium]